MIQTQVLRRVRFVAAILLIGALFLPLSECSLLRNDNSWGYGYEYIYSSVGVTVGAATVLAFFWPLIFVLLLRKRFGFRLRVFFQLLELLLCAGTIYWFNALAGGGKWLYGAYVGVVATVGFTCAGVVPWFVKTKSERQPGGEHGDAWQADESV
jgi:hypothetical protein